MSINPGIGQIIDIMSKHTINEQHILKIEEHIDDIDAKLSEKKIDTNKLSSLKDKLMFIEQFYINKTCIETEINCKIGRLEQNYEILKKNMENISRDIKFIKEQINILTINHTVKEKLNIFSKLFKKDFLFTNKR